MMKNGREIFDEAAIWIEERNETIWCVAQGTLWRGGQGAEAEQCSAQEEKPGEGAPSHAVWFEGGVCRM
jgi:hypothetical protein